MDFETFGAPVPLTRATFGALCGCERAAVADLLLLESWEIHRPMHLGVMLRVRQIRLANPFLAAEIEAELAAQRNAKTRAGSPSAH